MTKKGIVWVLLLAFCMQGMLCPATAAAEGNHEADIAFLEAVSIIEADVYEENTMLTRAEATKLLVQMAGMTRMAQSNTSFADVPFSDPYSGYVRAAAGLGVINGYGDGNFYPGNTVTYNQAVKMLVTLLGYAPQAEVAGGYPSGYLTVATRENMLRGTINTEGEITFGVFAHLVKNALNTDLFAPITYGSTDGRYTVLEGATVLSEYHGIDKAEGTVLADDFTTLTGDRVGEGKVLLESTVYETGKTDITTAIGHRVEAYIDRSAETVLYYEKKSASTEVIVESSNVLPENTTKAGLAYMAESGREELAKIDGEAVLVYNFAAKPGWDRADLILPQASIRLVSPDGGAAKYIFVEAYENLYIDSASAGTRTVYFKPGGSISRLVLDDNSFELSFVDSEGLPFEPLSVFEWDVVSVVRSTDGRYIRAIHCLDNVTGTVQEVSEKDIRIDEKQYPITANLRAMFDADAIGVGDKALFTLDFTGKVAAADTSQIVPYKYGWLVNASAGKGLSGKPQFKVFTEDGEMKVYTADDRVVLNGQSTLAANLLDGTNVLFENGAVKARLIRYELSANGTLTSIETDRDFTSDITNTERHSVFSRDFYIPEDGKINRVEVNFIGNKIQLFATKYAVRSTTKIFAIPDASAADEKYQILNSKTFTHGAHPDTSLYDIDEDNVIGAIVWDIGGVSGVGLSYPDYEVPAALISGMSTSLNEDGEEVTNIKLFTWEGETISVSEKSEYDKVLFKHANTDITKDPVVLANGGTKPDTILIDKLSVGDIVQYEVNPSGGFSTLNVWYRAATPGLYESSPNSGGSVFQTNINRNYFGHSMVSNFIVEKMTPFSLITHVDSVDPSTFVPDGGNFERSYPINYGAIILCEDAAKGTPKITPIGAGDIEIGDEAVTIWRLTQPLATIIFRN